MRDSVKYTLLHEVGDAAKQADEKVKSAVEVIAENGSHHYGVCHMRDVLSAKEAGMKTVLIPEGNEKDIEELDNEMTSGIDIIPGEQMEDILEQASLR